MFIKASSTFSSSAAGEFDKSLSFDGWVKREVANFLHVR